MRLRCNFRWTDVVLSLGVFYIRSCVSPNPAVGAVETGGSPVGPMADDADEASDGTSFSFWGNVKAD